MHVAQKTFVIVLTFAAMVILLARRLNRSNPARFPQLKGWQKVLGLIAVLLTLLVLLNPELLALGLLGDSTLFDLLVLAMSVQILVYLQSVWRWLRNGAARIAHRWF